MRRRVSSVRVQLQQEREAKEWAAWGEGGTFEDTTTPSCFCGAALSHPPELCCYICRAVAVTPIAPSASTTTSFDALRKTGRTPARYRATGAAGGRP